MKQARVPASTSKLITGQNQAQNLPTFIKNEDEYGVPKSANIENDNNQHHVKNEDEYGVPKSLVISTINMRPVKVADSEKKRKHLVDESEASKIGELVNQQIDS